ncbi:MAG TPA: PHP-associated domain-containing protein [Candidatus Binataceae bacterium]|nr:PHP-associated domain-containing protein [Candidatus Binataceae bacterium]
MRITALSTILDLHTHSEASEDSRAPVEAYLNWIKLRHAERPLDGIVLTEHRQYNREGEYRPLEDKFGLMVLRASEVETNYGHMLVFGVNDDILARFDFANIRLDAQTVIDEVAKMGGIVVPCHPGRPNIGLYEHYQAKPALENVVAVEALNGGSRKGEDERSEELIAKFGYAATGGSDSHLVSLIGLCATRFTADIKTIDDLVRELKSGNYEPADFRPRRKTVPHAVAVETR